MQRDLRRRIVSVRRDANGEINGFELNDHTVVDYQSALQLANQGELKDVNVVTEHGKPVIKGNIDNELTSNRHHQ